MKCFTNQNKKIESSCVSTTIPQPCPEIIISLNPVHLPPLSVLRVKVFVELQDELDQ